MMDTGGLQASLLSLNLFFLFLVDLSGVGAVLYGVGAMMDTGGLQASLFIFLVEKKIQTLQSSLTVHQSNLFGLFQVLH